MVVALYEEKTLASTLPCSRFPLKHKLYLGWTHLEGSGAGTYCSASMASLHIRFMNKNFIRKEPTLPGEAQKEYSGMKNYNLKTKIV